MPVTGFHLWQGVSQRPNKPSAEEGQMDASTWKRLLLSVAALQLAVAGCSTPQRLPAVPVSAISQASQAFGPVRFLVSRESDSFAAEARSALAKEQAWLASQGQTGELPPVHLLA